MQFAKSRFAMQSAKSRVAMSGLLVAALLFAWTTAPSARAEGFPSHATDANQTPPDALQSDDSSSKAIDRTWLYLDDAQVARPGRVIAMSSVSYTVGSNPDPTSEPYRAFAFNTAQPGALLSVGAEVGLLRRLSFTALGQLEAGGQNGNASPGAVAGVRFDLSPLSWRSVHLLASAGYLRETWSAPRWDGETGRLTAGQSNGDNGAWVEAALSADIHRLRLGVTTHGEHVFAEGRDGVDLMVKLGTSYRLVDWLRLGVEWVGQDLEESIKEAAEGGARHFVGPTAAVQLLSDRLTLVGGPSIGLSDPSPKLLARLAAAYAF